MRIRCLLFSEFINIEYILFYSFIEFFILLYSFLVIYFARDKNIWFDGCFFWKFLDVLPAFTCARTIDDFLSFSLGGNILLCERSVTPEPRELSPKNVLNLFLVIKIENLFNKIKYLFRIRIFIFRNFFFSQYITNMFYNFNI